MVMLFLCSGKLVLWKFILLFVRKLILWLLFVSNKCFCVVMLWIKSGIVLILIVLGRFFVRFIMMVILVWWFLLVRDKEL